jgi:hypothetical protein
MNTTTTAKYQVSAAAVQEIKAVIESGDVSLMEERTKYQITTGKTCTPADISDEKLIDALALTDDDDTELFVKNVDLVKAGEREEIA